MKEKDKDTIRDDFDEDKNLINEEIVDSSDDSDVKEYNIGDEIDFKALMEAEEDKAENTRPLYRSSELEQYREEYAMKMGANDTELNSWTYPSERKESKVLKFLGNIAQGFIGMALALAVFLYILPKTTVFKTSAMGKYISDISNNAAYDAASSVLANVSGKLSAFENQKEILSEVSTQKTMKVSEIVSQYKSAVVTVLTKNYQVPGDTNSGFRTFIGTGFILNSDGLVATNHHVIDGADEISVLLSDGTEVNATVINTDDATDLAIIRLDGNIKVEGVVTFGNSDEANVGDEVVAIGNPVSRNFSGTVTAGIISGKDRVVEIAGTKISYIQTDAAINEGNSGGPLFNDKGEVIGINTAKIHNNNTEGISFAIPINTLKEKMAILSQPPVYMGITSRDMDIEALRKLRISNGVEVIEVRQGSPAYNSGIQVGDVILKFNDIIVTSTTQMNEIKMKYKVGSEITLSILRGNDIIDKKFQLIARP
ncbi:MAG: trypsin-like peptidase domain-containing protein [Clostridiaceae bacterium]